jgi:hypothetical protein
MKDIKREEAGFTGYSRRNFIKMLPALTAIMSGMKSDKAPVVLLRSSWQTVNIGDIGHTPGALAILEKYLPEVQIILWPTKVDQGVDEMLLRNFPKLKIAQGRIGKDGQPDTDVLKNAFREADFLLHGSGPSIVAHHDVRAWKKATGKPYGIYGVTIVDLDEETVNLINHAAFIYCRDTASLDFLKTSGVKCPVMEFAPDATFGITLKDDDKAITYLKDVNLEKDSFVCLVPRLRYTPYWKIHGTTPTRTDRERAEVSERYRDKDHAKLRHVITAWVEQTGLKVLLCPEMTYQVELARTELYDPLPEHIRKQVVWRDRYWTPDEAASVYSMSKALVSMEMHSPIIAASVGTPAIHVRQPTDTRKGQMWRDIGLSEWLFEVDETDGEAIGQALLDIQKNYPEALKKLRKAMTYVEQRQESSMKKLKEHLPG